MKAKVKSQKSKIEQETPEEEVLFTSLRAQQWEQFYGQGEVKESINVAITAAKKRGEPIEHILLYGPPGLGKTTLSHLIAKGMGVNIRVTSGPAIERAGDLASILTNLEKGDVLFIDEVHRLNKVVEETLYPAMEDFALDVVIGKGPSARTLRLDLPQVTTTVDGAVVIAARGGRTPRACASGRSGTAAVMSRAAAGLRAATVVRRVTGPEPAEQSWSVTMHGLPPLAGAVAPGGAMNAGVMPRVWHKLWPRACAVKAPRPPPPRPASPRPASARRRTTPGGPPRPRPGRSCCTSPRPGRCCTGRSRSPRTRRRSSSG